MSDVPSSTPLWDPRPPPLPMNLEPPLHHRHEQIELSFPTCWSSRDCSSVRGGGFSMPAAGAPEPKPQPLKLRTWAWISCGAEDVVTSHSWMNGQQLHCRVPATSPRLARTGVVPCWSSTCPSSHPGLLLQNRTCPLCLPPPLVCRELVKTA